MSNSDDMFNASSPVESNISATEGERPVGSLSDYISKHLSRRTSAPKQEFKSTPSSLPTKPDMEVLLQSDAAEAYSHAQSPQYQGRVLHHLDSQLANSQLERYLPTPSTRYQMMRDRILKELTELENDLVQYRQLQGWEYDTKIEALEERLSLLRHKLQLVDDKLSEINPFQSMYTTLARLKPGAASAEAKRKPKRGPWAFIPNPNRDICNEVAEINLELETLQHIMEEQLHDPCFTADQIGRLVNQYDLNLRKAEKMIAKLKSRRSLTEKLNTKLNDFYRSLYRDQR